MNGVMRAAFKLSSLKTITNPLKQALLPGIRFAGTPKQQHIRTLWHMSSTIKSEDSNIPRTSMLCSCGCGSQRLQHTKSNINAYTVTNSLYHNLSNIFSSEKCKCNKQNNLNQILASSKDKLVTVKLKLILVNLSLL